MRIIFLIVVCFGVLYTVSSFLLHRKGVLVMKRMALLTLSLLLFFSFSSCAPAAGDPLLDALVSIPFGISQEEFIAQAEKETGITFVPDTSLLSEGYEYCFEPD